MWQRLGNGAKGRDRRIREVVPIRLFTGRLHLDEDLKAEAEEIWRKKNEVQAPEETAGGRTEDKLPGPDQQKGDRKQITVFPRFDLKNVLIGARPASVSFAYGESVVHGPLANQMAGIRSHQKKEEKICKRRDRGSDG